MRILALDVATRMGVADGRPGENPALTTINLGREYDKHGDVFARAALWIVRRMLDQRPDQLVLERPVGIHDSALLMGLRGIMLGLARAHDVPVVEVAVQTWRAYFLGSGNMKKAAAKARAVEWCGKLGWGQDLDHNAAEAGGMWLWACAKALPREVPRHEPLFMQGAKK